MLVDGVHHRTIWTEPDDPGAVHVIDQRVLPFSFETIRVTSSSQMASVIADMVVRGAGLIGVAAAYGMSLAARTAAEATTTDEARAGLHAAADELRDSRPTAVNLAWAVDRMLGVLDDSRLDDLVGTAAAEARAIADEDVAACQALARHGLPLIDEIHERTGKTVNVLTHCNAGWLAFVDHGSATAPIYAAHDAGIPVHVWVDETRPRNQGARLTAWELGQHGVAHSVIVDNAGGHLMQHGHVDLVLVGSDRTTVTGDVANKIGTYLKALAAHDNGVPFHVALPSSSIDWGARDGLADIAIEERDPVEVTHITGETDQAASNGPTTTGVSPYAHGHRCRQLRLRRHTRPVGHGPHHRTRSLLGPRVGAHGAVSRTRPDRSGFCVRDEWDDEAAAELGGPIAECVYCTRLIGADPALVLHGGGNSSVKAPREDVTGRVVEAIHVKGSGWDMATIEAPGLAPLDLARLRDLLELEALSDPDMMRELAAAKLDPAAPNPSVESLLHAHLPHRAVQHSHADVIVTLTNLAGGPDIVQEVYGDDVVVVPYVMPGFDLARRVKELWPEQAHDATTGMVLCNHGLFTFGDDSATAYRRHVDLITRAEQWLEREAPRAREAAEGESASLPPAAPIELTRLRRQISEAAGSPMIVRRHADSAVSRFVARPDLDSLANRGPLTPDHVIRTKPRPMVGRDVEGYAAAYREYVADHRHRSGQEPTKLDPAPRMVFDSELGLLAVGRSAKDARIVADIAHHTIPVWTRAHDHLGGYEGLPLADLFDMEYWDLEQAKLRLGGPPSELSGSVAIVTGAASGIGRACAAELLGHGAAVIGLDIDPQITNPMPDAPARDAWFGVQVDVTDESAVGDSLATAVERFGGIDIAVVAAGVFGPSAPIASLNQDDWQSTMAVNVDAVATLFAHLAPLLAESPIGGRVAVIGSKNVPAPGKGAAAYSASKAALRQLCRVAALEWAGAGVRVNTVDPDAVFNTGLWTDELIAERAARYDLTPEEYRRRNLLGIEISSTTVAKGVIALCRDDFAATTGANVPMDGGSDRVI